MTTKCPICEQEIGYSLIPVSAHPDAEGCCYDCLPDDAQAAYDRFFGSEDSEKKNVDVTGMNDGIWIRRVTYETEVWYQPTRQDVQIVCWNRDREWVCSGYSGTIRSLLLAGF